jgi:hypothetical protein
MLIIIITDCGQYVNGVGSGTKFEATVPGMTDPPLGSCAEWTDAETWGPEKRKGFYDLFLAGADAAQVSTVHNCVL